MSLRLGALAAQHRHLGPRQRGHAGVVELGIARRHQPPKVEGARLLLHGQFQIAHRFAVVVRLVGLEQGAGKVDLYHGGPRQQLDGAPVGGDGLVGAAVFIQHLAAHFVEVGVVGVFLDQPIDAEQRRSQRRLAVPGDRPRVARRHRAVGFGETLQGDIGRDEAHQLGDDAVMHRQEFRRIGRVGVGRARHRLLERRDALRRQRMGREVRIAPVELHALFLLQHAQEFDRAFGRLAGALQKGDARLVRRVLLGLRVLQERQQRTGSIGGAGARCRTASAGAAARGGGSRHGAAGQDHLEDLQRREAAQLLLHARQMAAGDVAAFMRQHADQLVGRLGAHDQAGVDEDALAARHEGVERIVLDDHDLDRVGIETGGLPDRHHHGADVVLDFGVADQIEPLTLLRARGTKRRQREQRETEEGGNAFEHGRHGLSAG